MKPLGWLMLIFVFSCGSPEQVYLLPETYVNSLPDSLQQLTAYHKAQIILGRTLFYDPVLSRDSSMSCGSCHAPSAAFGDRMRISLGIGHQLSGVRNTPPLFNLFWRSSFFRDGGIPRLEQVALAPMQDHNELDLPLEELTLRLRANTTYLKKFEEVYGQSPDPYTITRALAWFQRSLISLSSPFDAWQAGKTVLSAEAIAGWELFQQEKLACQRCHPAPAFSDDQFHHIGIATEGIDTGRAQISYQWDDFGRFRTPSLRNLSFTGPYMHDGSINTLEEVVNYFNQGGNDHPLKHPAIQPLGLSDLEQIQLIAFLKSLNDTVFINWPAYQVQAADYQD